MAVKAYRWKPIAAAALSVAASVFAPSAAALANVAPTASDYGVAPWTEAIVSVSDLEQSSQWLVEDGGWRIVAKGAINRAELDYWHLPASVSGAFLKICAPETRAGCIRYVRFDGAKGQRPIRLAARPWDTGGIFSVMLRSDDTQALFDAAIARGWWAESQPYAFSFAGSDLLNVVIRGPHGVNYALYQRNSPPFTGFRVGRLSQAFNTMRMVRDQPASVAWYRDRLGLKTLFDAPFTDPEPRANNFSVPANLATKLVRRAAVVQPVLPGEDGRIELMQFEGFEGRDYAVHASPPNLGIISVRYSVRDLSAYTSFLKGNGVAPVYADEGVAIAGTGTADIVAVRDPDGNLTEFYHVH
ncbi:VOC family protein [Erythrobacter sp.]|uniref:VOC family protein n=1 Tax=Erythrobacter sp. TaxID=1042 RepID=UPI0025F6E168|nr:VOC family protein [Erythrobacter sp.]